MDRAWYNLIIVLNILLISIILVYGETYSVKIGEEHVNIVDKNFLSFTVDPMHLFSSVEAYNNKECTCMASFLTPAYLRIAGPSTSHMTFENTSITIDKADDYGTKQKSKPNFFKNLIKKRKRQTPQSIKISNRQWRDFIQWAKKTGFDLVFALNNEERTSSGLWDPSSTLTVLSLAEKANIEDIVWQLGYECNNKTIDEYLNDLETLRVLTESIQGEKPLRWKTAGGDITGCLKDASDFRDYVALAVGMSDVLLLNGNSSSQELDRMSASDRIKLLTQIHHSATPLWISEHPQWNTDMERAADWMAGLGYSARNGFSVHFRELIAEELYEPSLSFYMALLYKNFVGDRVLPVDFDSTQAILFAHCTSLRHKPVPKAVTLYGVNLDDEPARLSIKLTKKEEGGEIMQFIMKQEENGDILVNRRVISSEGDFRPVVKHVRPYKNLLLHLPAKSFGFWVLANTNIKDCQEAKNDKKDIDKTALNKSDDESEDNEKVRRKRFTGNDNLESDLYDAEIVDDIDNSIDTAALKEMIFNLNNELKDAQNFFKLNTINIHRKRRQVPDGQNSIRKLRRQQMKPKKDIKKYDDFERKPILSFIRSMVQLTRKNTTQSTRKPSRLHKRRFGNKYFYDMSQNADRNDETYKVSRSRRSVIGDKNEARYINKDSIIDNEIDIENKDKKLWHVFNRIQDQLDKMAADLSQNDNNSEPKDKSQESENVILKTEISDDSATINFSESTGTGLVKTTFDNLYSVLGEVNSKLSKLWTVLSILE